MLSGDAHAAGLETTLGVTRICEVFHFKGEHPRLQRAIHQEHLVLKLTNSIYTLNYKTLIPRVPFREVPGHQDAWIVPFVQFESLAMWILLVLVCR